MNKTKNARTLLFKGIAVRAFLPSEEVIGIWFYEVKRIEDP